MVTDRHSNEPRIKSALIPALITGFIAVLFYFHEFITLPASGIPSDYPDGKVFSWNFWWIQFASENNFSFFYSPFIFHPSGTSLVLHTLLPAMTIPLALLAGNLFTPFQLFTLTAILCFALNFVAGYLLFFRLSSKRLVAPVLSLILTFHPFFTGHLRGGHLNFLVFFPLLLAVHFNLKQLQINRQYLKLQLLIVASVVILVWSNLYYFYFYSLFTGCIAFFLMLERKNFLKRATILFLPLLAGCILSLPRLISLYTAASSGLFTPHHQASLHSADLISFFLPAGNQIFGKIPILKSQQLLSAGPAENGLYLSWALLISFFLISKKLKEPFVLMLSGSAVFFLLLALGPSISICGIDLIQNPVYLLFSYLPQFPQTPVRFGLMVILLLYATIAKGLSNTTVKKRSVFIFIIATLEMLPVFPHSYYLQSSSVIETIKGRPDNYALLDWSPIAEDAMARQIIHHKRISRAFVARRPKKAVLFLQKNPFIRKIAGKQLKRDYFLPDAFKKLKVDGVLISEADTTALEFLTDLSWLKIVETDGTYRLYEPVP